MLQNGLGDLIKREVQGATRFIDLFTGSAAISTHVAVHYEVPVNAYDLQNFSAVLAGAIVTRECKLNPNKLWTKWYGQAKDIRKTIRPPSALAITRDIVKEHRSWCAGRPWFLTRAYGGYYFSALQATWLDSLRQTLPGEEPGRTVALAALIWAASKCAAAPGHTAQPFQPTRTARPFLLDAWNKKVVSYCQSALSMICEQHARTKGFARVADANEVTGELNEGDLVFIDPPYSGVHYSRFYHVLETIARGQCGEVSGTGRYPPANERPRSKYSIQSESSAALADLLRSISSRGAKAIITFPQRPCSNGLSGTVVTQLANAYFKTEKHWVSSKFSTLGGNNNHRNARSSTRELILVLHKP